jgi:hypothetical protein
VSWWWQRRQGTRFDFAKDTELWLVDGGALLRDESLQREGLRKERVVVVVENGEGGKTGEILKIKADIKR